MRVLQRLAGRENPLTTLKVYEHTLHFRGGVAEIPELTEREIIRLRTFGFRVERDTGPRPKAKVIPTAPELEKSADPDLSEELSEGSPEPVVLPAEAAEAEPTPQAKRSHKKKALTE